ncbi:plasmid stabilization protein [Chlorobium sp.]|uniref:plasmid stabilization protein n=1 Tax=Chlorobium sp. TaxID=1095 RepID=UPI002F427F81
MPRGPRLDSPGTLHHVIILGIEKREIVADDKDRGIFVSAMGSVVVEELLDQGINFYRELLIQHWRLLYRIAEDRVFILSIIDSRRNVEDILLHRFLGL